MLSFIASSYGIFALSKMYSWLAMGDGIRERGLKRIGMGFIFRCGKNTAYICKIQCCAWIRIRMDPHGSA
jgi:hypothetical protein